MNTAIILAAGMGLRLGGQVPKQFMTIDGVPLLQFSVRTFLKHKSIDKIIIVSKANHCKQVAMEYPDCTVVAGGETRHESSKLGVEAAIDSEIVLIHDAARPFLSSEIITSCLDALNEYDAVAPVLEMTDSIVQVNGKEISSVERSRLRLTQTPQAFHYSTIEKAQNISLPPEVTDEIGLVLKSNIGAQVALVPGDSFNFKVTTRADFVFAEQLMRNQNQVNNLKFDASGKKALVLGGTSGIGSAIAKRLEDLGASVTIAGSEIQVQKSDSLSLFDNQIWDIIVHSMGVMSVNNKSIIVPLEEMSYEMWDESMRINLFSIYHVAHLALKTMVNGGHIVVIGSSSSKQGREGFTAYSAAKAGLTSVVQGFSEEVLDKNIMINLINPSRTDTKMRAVFSGEDKEKMLPPNRVAEIAVSYCHGSTTGQVFDLRVGE